MKFGRGIYDFIRHGHRYFGVIPMVTVVPAFFLFLILKLSTEHQRFKVARELSDSGQTAEMKAEIKSLQERFADKVAKGEFNRELLQEIKNLPHNIQSDAFVKKILDRDKFSTFQHVTMGAFVGILFSATGASFAAVAYQEPKLFMRVLGGLQIGFSLLGYHFDSSLNKAIQKAKFVLGKPQKSAFVQNGSEPLIQNSPEHSAFLELLLLGNVESSTLQDLEKSWDMGVRLREETLSRLDALTSAADSIFSGQLNKLDRLQDIKNKIERYRANSTSDLRIALLDEVAAFIAETRLDEEGVSKDLFDRNELTRTVAGEHLSTLSCTYVLQRLIAIRR